MFILHQSNRLETLLEQLLMLLETPLADVMAPETVIVQSQGMARWLSLMLAEKQGVCANLDCPFPASFIWRVYAGLDSARRDGPPPYEPDALVWSIMEIIGQLQEEPAFCGVKGYIDRQGSELRRYQLASKVAELFGQYMVQRPEWIRDWGRGGGAPLKNEADCRNVNESHGWQAMIWRKLLERHGNTHRVALFDEMQTHSPEDLLRKISLPERICLFGIPAMPQSQLDVFSHLSHCIDVHLFLLTPSQNYWADLVSKKDVVKARLTSQGLDPILDLHFEEGCQLLMGLGRLGRDFQTLLLSLDECKEEAGFVDPGSETLLSFIQADILAATRNEPAPEQVGLQYAVDSSLQIHAAHSPMREVEILYDQLLDTLQSNEGLEARDILVMVPDISKYAPMIDAVFSHQAESSMYIPFSIADRAGPGAMAKIFFDLLSLAGSRAGVNQVLAVLDQESVRTHFGISADEMTAMKTHIAQTSIHWGLDSTHRQRFGVPPEELGSWQQGLDRMLLGYMMPGGDEHIFEGILPYDLLEGSDGELLGKLLHFYQALSSLTEQCRHRYTLGQWRDILSNVLDTFVGSREEHHRPIQRIRSVIDELAAHAETAKVSEKISLEVVSTALEKKVSVSFGHDFLCGRVTFCQMVPMRSIPFQVICLLGMNDSTFPRYERPVGFDLMEGKQRAGDRNRRDDDRYLFLETILSARQTLYISYVGLNDRDHREVPPSVVVSELLDHIGQRLSWSSEQRLGFVRRHPLQPFSRKYFSGDFFSYSHPNSEIAVKLGTNNVHGGLFADSEAIQESELKEVAVHDFIRFFEHPVRSLLRNRFDLFLGDYFDQPEDRECFSLDSLENYKLAAAFTERVLSGRLHENQQVISQKKGELPAGRGGEYYYDKIKSQVGGFAWEIEKVRGPEKLDSLDVSLTFGSFRLVGSLNAVWSNGQCLYRPSLSKNIGYRGLVGAWIHHLLLNALETDAPGQTYFVFRDKCRGYDPYPDARQELSVLAELFIVGQSSPLPLFPRSSYAYAQVMWGSAKEDADLRKKALAKAEALWQGGDFLLETPEREDPYLAATFGAGNPFTQKGPVNFEEAAEKVLMKAIKLLQQF